MENSKEVSAKAGPPPHNPRKGIVSSSGHDVYEINFNFPWRHEAAKQTPKKDTRSSAKEIVSKKSDALVRTVIESVMDP
jgi:hypothetical protein